MWHVRESAPVPAKESVPRRKGARLGSSGSRFSGWSHWAWTCVRVGVRVGVRVRVRVGVRVGVRVRVRGLGFGVGVRVRVSPWAWTCGSAATPIWTRKPDRQRERERMGYDTAHRYILLPPLSSRTWDHPVEDLVVKEARGDQVEQAVDTRGREGAVDLDSEVARRRRELQPRHLGLDDRRRVVATAAHARNKVVEKVHRSAHSAAR
eukprot:scaffold83031_cov44-Phaeocystis_antarctica.AAC.3